MADQAEINGLLLLLAPRSGPPPCLCAAFVFAVRPAALDRHCMGHMYPCIPLDRPPPSVTGDNFALLVFLPCTHRAYGSSPIPNSAALHCTQEAPNPPKSQPREEEASPRSCITSPPTDLPITHLPPPSPTTIRHCRLSLLGLVPSFCLLFFLHQPKSGPAGDGTDLTAKPHVWLAQHRPPPPPSFMLIQALEPRSTIIQ